MPSTKTVPLHRAASERYLNYALSVITSRALPDVRDGLKPVQRRILYTMFHELALRHGGRHRKSAAVVGEVMGKYHPHGDQAIYDALVRMAQPFSLRQPLIDGQGNFGSLDNDPAAAMRYTECKLTALAEELLSEIKKKTIDYRPTYDGQRVEPIVLPSQLPHLLLNGSEGIAVGMATKIPPHNLGEVVSAAVAMIDEPELALEGILEHIKGPDFPTGARLLSTPEEIYKIYETGHGSLRIQATWEVGKEGRRTQVILTSIPYGQNKARIIERIGEQVRNKKLPQVHDIRDESTEDVRIVLDLKQGSSPEAVAAYLFKHTHLECTWPVNLTALVPTEVSEVARPSRLDLRSMLRYWLDYRLETVRRRYTYDLEQLKERIHLLEGLAKIFLDLDEAIRIIRESEGRRDAHEKLMKKFKLSDVQTDAILELRLYRLAKLEIQLILDELKEKREAAAAIKAILASESELWGRVRAELVELGSLYTTPRRTLVEASGKTLSYDEDAYIVSEDTWVVVTRSGWIKRQSSFTDVSKIRVREDDEIGWLVQANTRSTLAFFGSNGGSYVLRVDDVPATTGYGEPLQRRFAFADGERVVGVVSQDPRHTRPEDAPEDDPRPSTGIALTTQGRVLRFPLATHASTSKRAGRKYARLRDGDQVFSVYPVGDDAHLCIATRLGRALTFPCAEVPCLRAAGKGVTGVKLREEDVVFAAGLSHHPGDGPKVATSFGRDEVIRPRKFEGKRGGRGKVLLKRGSINEWEMEPEIVSFDPAPSTPAPPEDTGSPETVTSEEDVEASQADGDASTAETPGTEEVLEAPPAPSTAEPRKAQEAEAKPQAKEAKKAKAKPQAKEAKKAKAKPQAKEAKKPKETKKAKAPDFSNAPLFAGTLPPDDVPTDVDGDEGGAD